jgi:translation initiation factor 4G
MRQNASMSHDGSRGDGNCDGADPSHPDGSSVVGPSVPTRQLPKAGDLSQFGKVSKATSISFDPGNTFTVKKVTDPKNRVPPMSSVSQRPKLQLLPRSRPVGEGSKASTPTASEPGSEDEAAGQTGSLAPAAMSEAESKTKIQEDIKEFFSIRILEEAESYFSSLPPEHRHWLVDSLVTKSIEMKEPDVNLVSELFVRVREKELCSPAVFEEGFTGLAEALDDLAVDIPKAWPYFAILLRGSGLDQNEERRGRIAEKTMDPDKLNRLS